MRTWAGETTLRLWRGSAMVTGKDQPVEGQFTSKVKWGSTIPWYSHIWTTVVSCGSVGKCCNRSWREFRTMAWDWSVPNQLEHLVRTWERARGGHPEVERRENFRLTHIHRCVHNHVPGYLSDSVQTNESCGRQFTYKSVAEIESKEGTYKCWPEFYLLLRGTGMGLLTSECTRDGEY